MSADIQRARDVLAKLRRYMSPDPWRITGAVVSDTSGTTIADYEDVQNIEARRAALANVKLIVGTAGNPDLLDAIDGMLATWDEAEFVSADLGHHIQRMAAAIIAADERMSS